MRLLPETGEVLLAVAIVSASIILRPAQPAIAEQRPSEPQHITIVQEPPVVNVEIVESPQEPAVVNVRVDVPEQAPSIVNVKPSAPQIIYEDREVERIVTVEVPSCLDYTALPYFDLANALTVAFPGEPWSLSGSHYPGLVWHGDSPMPEMTDIIGGWLTSLAESC